MSYNPGDVLLIRFPFTNRQGPKQRPAAVVSSSDYNTERADVILLALTSQIRTPLGFGEALVQDWHEAGLLKPSVLKQILFTVEQTLVRKTLGQLGNRDRETLRDVLRNLIDFG